jgi:hypothetical protein
MLERINTFLAAMVIALVVALAVVTLSPPLPITEKQQHAAQQTPKQEAAKHSPWSEFWDWTTHDPVAFYTFIVGAFTGVLAISTIGLWIATILTLRQSRDTAERQLRAYVFMQGAQVMIMNNNTAILATIAVKNFGQTPAYRVRSWAKVAVCAIDVQPSDDIAPPIVAESVMGPGAEFHMQPAINATALQLQDTKNGTNKICVWGKLEYVDAFNVPQVFTYRGVNGHEAAGPGWAGWHLNTPHVN